jgi:hypothetical protein
MSPPGHVAHQGTEPWLIAKTGPGNGQILVALPAPFRNSIVIGTTADVGEVVTNPGQSRLL